MSRYYDDNIFHSGIDEDELLHYGVKGMKWRKRLKSRIGKSALQDNREAKRSKEMASLYGRKSEYSHQEAANYNKPRYMTTTEKYAVWLNQKTRAAGSKQAKKRC